MWLLLLEAGVALFLLVFIVWWTMFSGRKQEPSPPPKTLPPKEDTLGANTPGVDNKPDRN